METLLEKWLAERKVAINRTQAKRLDEQATVRWLQQRLARNSSPYQTTDQMHQPHQLDRGTL